MTTPRLEPLEKAPTLLGKLMSLAYRWQLGRTITPARVLYNRVPRMWNVSWALVNLDLRGYTLDEEITLLVHTRTSQLNGCGFCKDIAAARAVQQRLGMEKFQALEDWASSPLFSERERAALAYADEVTRTRDASDATWEGLRKQFDEREAAEVVVCTAVSNFYNLLNVPLRIEEDGLRELAEARLH